MKSKYEAPAVEELGSIADVTAGYKGPKSDFIIGTPCGKFSDLTCQPGGS